MAIKTLPDRDLVLKLLRYEPETGELFWRPRPVEMFSSPAQAKRWNSRHAGRKAGYLKKNGYTTVSILAIAYRAHRLIWLMLHGEPVPDLIDHEDRGGSNNTELNLRAATDAQNMANRKLNSNSSTGFKGVQEVNGKFRVQIDANGSRHVRTFNRIEEAIEHRRYMANIMHGEFARD